MLTPDLARGLFAGLLALLVVWLCGAAWRRDGREPFPVAGLALVGASLAAMSGKLLLSSELVVGLALLVGAGLFADLHPRLRRFLPLLAFPGAVVICGSGELVGTGWVRVLVAVAIVAGGPLVAAFDHRWRHQGYGPVLFAVTVAGAYATVPETGRLVVVLGVAAALSLAGWPIPVASLGSAGSLVVTGLLVWTSATGGLERPSSIVGASACLGLLVVEPVGRALVRSGASALDSLPDRWWSCAVVAGAQAVVVAVASRAAGLQVETGRAVVIAVVDLLVTLALVVALGANRREPSLRR